MSKDKSLTKRTLGALLWRMLEKGGQYVVQLVVQIILARVLAPEDYGVYAILAAIIVLLNTVIQVGMQSALIQDNNVTDADYSSVFWLNLLLATLAYVLLFLFAPILSDFFSMPGLTAPLRVSSLVLFISVYNSMQMCKLMKELDFKIIFFRTILAVTISGFAGVVFAVEGFGIWALVIQQLVYQIVAGIYFAVTNPWVPCLVLSIPRLKKLFSFGWKMCLSGLLKNGYDSFIDLAMGKSVSSTTLGLFNRGRKFAQIASSAVDDPVKTVLFPAFSKKQDNLDATRTALRKVVCTYSFFAAPVLLGAVYFAEPLIVLLLTDQWIGSVVFFQLCCVSYALFSLQTPCLQAFNALGRSDIPTILESIRLGFSLLSFFVAVALGCTAVQLVLVITIVNLLVSMMVIVPNKRVLLYSSLFQIKDYTVPFACSAVSLTIVWLVPILFNIQIGGFLYAIQAIAFVMVYMLLSKIVGIKSLETIISIIKH